LSGGEGNLFTGGVGEGGKGLRCEGQGGERAFCSDRRRGKKILFKIGGFVSEKPWPLGRKGSGICSECKGGEDDVLSCQGHLEKR